MGKEVVYNYSDYPDDKWISLDPIFLDKDIDLPEDYKGRWMINKKYQILNMLSEYKTLKEKTQ